MEGKPAFTAGKNAGGKAAAALTGSRPVYIAVFMLTGMKCIGRQAADTKTLVEGKHLFLLIKIESGTSGGR